MRIPLNKLNLYLVKFPVISILIFFLFSGTAMYLHPGSENQTIYSKLVIALGQLFREDMKPEEEKMKSAKLQASVQARIAERAHNFTDEKTKAAFQNRIAAKKREEAG